MALGMMTQPLRWLVFAIGGVAGLILVVLLGSLALIESAEVVNIQTRDAAETYTTRVWIVDYRDRQ